MPRQCIYKGCTTGARYSVPGKPGKVSCAKHKIEVGKQLGAVLIVKKTKCKIPECDREAKYSLKSDERNRKVRCEEHKTDDHHKKKKNGKKCTGCNKIKTDVIYGPIKRGKRIHCKACKKENEYNVSKCCLEGLCDKTAYYNFKGGVIKYCFVHKKEGMVDVGTKRCIIPGCKKQAVFHVKGTTGNLYCTPHGKAHGGTRFQSALCKICKSARHNYKHHRCCYKCYQKCYKEHFMLNDLPKRTETHPTECMIFRFLNESKLCFIYNCKLDGAKSSYVPDIHLDLKEQTLIVEIDEGQHKQGRYTNEDERIIALHKDVNEGPMSVIRFNPDSYFDAKKLYHPGMITVNVKTGQLEFLETERYRLNSLVDTIVKCAQNPPKGLRITKMFYTDYTI